MARFEEIADRLASEILAGRHGGLYSRFMPVRELARRFSVSLTTAHKVVTRLKSDGLLIGDSTNPPQISPEVARRIAAADKKTPRRLGVLVSDLTNPFFSQLCGHVQRIAMTMDYQLLPASSGYDLQREQKAIRGFLEIGVE